MLVLEHKPILAHLIEIKAMEATISHTILAYLLALRDFAATLSDQEKDSFKKVAKDLNIQPKAWKSHIEPSLIQTIQGNPQLHQSYQSYKEKLDRLGNIPFDLLPKAGEINQLFPNQSSFVIKGFIPDSSASGYEQQLNNVVIVVNHAAEFLGTSRKVIVAGTLQTSAGRLIFAELKERAVHAAAASSAEVPQTGEAASARELSV